MVNENVILNILTLPFTFQGENQKIFIKKIKINM
jgi:hypothetical protein